MFASSRSPLPIPVEIVLASGDPLSETGFADVRLRRAERGGARSSWTAVITVGAPVLLDPDSVLARADGFLVGDREGPVGVVDEVASTQADDGGTIVVACGWFGRRRLTVGFQDVVEIRPVERRLMLRPGCPAVVGPPCREHSIARVFDRFRARFFRPLFGSRRRRGGLSG
jgi:hypothetical protein